MDEAHNDGGDVWGMIEAVSERLTVHQLLTSSSSRYGLAAVVRVISGFENRWQLWRWWEP